MSKGLVLGLALAGGLGAIVASQQPEIRRYLRIRSM